jgi:beta-glucosidase
MNRVQRLPLAALVASSMLLSETAQAQEKLPYRNPALPVEQRVLGSQDDLAKAMVETGKPVVVLLLHGRPNSVNYIAEKVPASLDGWYLGQEGGRAVADVLFGDLTRGGRLPITVPRNAGQLPDYYYQKPSARRRYLGSPTQPPFPFGSGLS